MDGEFNHNFQVYLQAGNDHTRCFTNYESILIDTQAFNENIMVLLLRRFGELRKETVEWWAKAPEGSVYFPMFDNKPATIRPPFPKKTRRVF
jgi:hypothetical protein